MHKEILMAKDNKQKWSITIITKKSQVKAIIR
jgi:hypothetical protein